MFTVTLPNHLKRYLFKVFRDRNRFNSRSKHKIIKEVLLKYQEVSSQIEITTLADIPAGTGLGSPEVLHVPY